MNNKFSAVLFALFICVSVSIFSTSCGTDNDADIVAIKQLKQEKVGLLSDIDSLQIMYNNMLENVDTLTATIEKANTEIAARNGEIASLRKDAGKGNKTAAALRAEVSQLKVTKTEYENIINGMRNEIVKLTKEKSDLMDDLDVAGEKNDALAYEIEDLKLLVRGMEEELDQRRIDGVKATNLRFEVMKKGNKPTASNKRARVIVMDFDLNDIPAEVRGKTKLYFAIRDAKTGVPIKSTNPIKASVDPKNGKAFSFIAQEVQELDLNESQRIQMRHNLQTRLNKGSYRASVYSDLGLIGAVSFRLR